MTAPTQNREREAIRIMELIGQAFDLVGLRPLPNHWDDCSGREKDAFLELAAKLVPVETPPAAPPPVGVERLAAELFKAMGGMKSVEEIEADITTNPGDWIASLRQAHRALALLHPQPAAPPAPEPEHPATIKAREIRADLLPEREPLEKRLARLEKAHVELSQLLRHTLSQQFGERGVLPALIEVEDRIRKGMEDAAAKKGSTP